MAMPQEAPETTPAISVVDLHKSFGTLHVLKGISCDIAAGEVVCVIGSSGSGKSTMLRCINRLETPERGQVFIHGDPIGFVAGTGGTLRPADEATLARQRSRIGYVFQHFNLWPHRTALGNVAEALMVVKGMGRDKAESVAMSRLTDVGLADKRDDYPSTLSGGEQQRVAIARMLAMEPDVLLFDEPTSALDPERVGEVIDVMRELATAGNTMMIATHEMSFARDTSDRMIFLDEGVIAEAAPTKPFFESPEKERTRAFLQRMLR
jgi:ABC-type histidine transport system ATPase subunit